MSRRPDSGRDSRGARGARAPLLGLRRGWRLLAAGAFVFAGFSVVGDATAVPATTWMGIYRMQDFDAWEDLVAFFAQLRTGIPPALSFVEICETILHGEPSWATGPLYRTSLVLGFLLPALVLARSGVEFALSLCIGFVFLWSTVVVTRPNPLAYDVLLPLLLLLSIGCVQLAARASGRAAGTWLATAAGTCLALAELTRPFVLLVLPWLMLHAWVELRGRPRSLLVAGLLPILLLSGGWHLKLALLQHGQVLWSNHSGFNLRRGWHTALPDWPAVPAPGDPEYREHAHLPFPGTGPFPGNNRHNTEADARVSRIYTRAVLDFVLAHPVDAARHVATRVATLLQPRTALFFVIPTHPVLNAYRPLVRITALYLALNLAWLCVRLVRERNLAPLRGSAGAAVPVGAAITVLVAIGEAGEEARFVVSVLPILAGLPRCFGETRATLPDGLIMESRRLTNPSPPPAGARSPGSAMGVTLASAKQKTISSEIDATL